MKAGRLILLAALCGAACARDTLTGTDAALPSAFATAIVPDPTYQPLMCAAAPLRHAPSLTPADAALGPLTWPSRLAPGLALLDRGCS